MKTYDLLIVGAGVSGAALLHLCSRYTNINSIAIVERREGCAGINTHPSQNSQTMHCGDIETNYTIEKAHTVRRATDMLRNYAKSSRTADDIIFKYPKMVLGVGKKECDFLRERFEEFSPFYPNLKLMDKDDIAKIEKNVVVGRDDEIVALGSTDEYTAIDFKALTRSFITNAIMSGKDVDVCYNQEIVRITDGGQYGFLVETQDKFYHAYSVVVCAGAHSLKIAHNMGYGLHYSVLPVAGSYYFTPEVLNGKVYTVQNDKLPFAAVHGDPDVSVPNVTRFGPTASVLPLLERRNFKSIPEFFKVFRFDKDVAVALWKALKVKDIRKYMIRNSFLGLPIIGKWMFLKDVRKIIPTMSYNKLKYAKGFGGIRPQLINRRTRELVMGEAKINEGYPIIFNVTPSPGGTSCIENAERDMRAVAYNLNLTIDEEKFKIELDR